MSTYRSSHNMHRFGMLGSLAIFVMFLSGCATNPAAQSGSHDSSFDAGSDRPASVTTLYTMARILTRQERFSEAEQVLRAILQQDGHFVPAYAALAELQGTLGRWNEALDTLKSGLVVAPDDAILHNDVGMCHVELGDYVSALESFTRAAELDSSRVRYRGNRAMALGMLGRYDECLGVYLKSLSPADAHYNLAVLCQARGDKQRSQEEFSCAQALYAAARDQNHAAPSDHPSTPVHDIPTNAGSRDGAP